MTDIKADLHDLLAKRMLEVLRDGRDFVGEDGAVTRVTASAADFNAVRQFLRDNGINSVKAVDSPISELVSEMNQRGLRFGNYTKRKAV